jgi:hypothetical protein
MKAKKVVSEAEVHEAITVILEDKAAYPTSLNWAVNYCQASTCMSGEDLRVQCLYVLNNIHRWRHPMAANVRSTLKAFAAQKKKGR